MYLAIEIASGGLSGGLGSVIAGGDFWKGAEQGVIATAYNHAVHGLYNKITQDSKSPYDGYRKDKNGNYIRVDSRGGDKIDYLYDEEGNIIASTPVSFTEIEVGPYRRTYGQGTKYVSPALYDPSFDIFAWWASGEVLGAALVKAYRYLSGVGRAAKTVSTGTNTVYRGLDAAGKVRYVGITNRTPAVRFAEHLGSGTNKALLRYEAIPGASNLSRTGARVWEQALINQYGLGKNGGLLFNKINSISPSKWYLHGIK